MTAATIGITCDCGIARTVTISGCGNHFSTGELAALEILVQNEIDAITQTSGKNTDFLEDLLKKIGRMT